MCGYVRTPPPQKICQNDAITLKSLRTIDSGQKRQDVPPMPLPQNHVKIVFWPKLSALIALYL